MSSRPVYRYVLRWRHLVNAYEVTAAGAVDVTAAPFVLAAYARAKPCYFVTGCSGLRANTGSVYMHLLAFVTA